MDWRLAYTPQIWPPAFTALVLTALALYTFRRRSVPGALPFAYAVLLGAVWMVGACLELAAVDITTRTFWIKFQDAVLLPAATAVICFLLEYAWPGRWLTRRNLALLSIPCFLNVGMILTNDLHHLYQPEFAFDGGAIPLRGVGNWIFLAYAYGLMIVNLLVLAWLFIRSPQHRWPVVLMLAGQVGARVLYVLDALEVIHSSVPIEVFAFWLPIPMYLIALFGFRILNPIPLARQTVIEQLRDGMLVLDLQGRVASLNPAAELILAAPLKHVGGKPIEAILPKLAVPGSPLVDGGGVAKSIEITLGPGAEARCYELESFPLDDFRGTPVGRLLLLHDVTEQRQSQAQILQQQRALATLNEREHLARELHDGLGQALAATHLQVSTARKLLDRGEIMQVGECLDGLADTTLQAEADMREYLLGAQALVSAKQSFLAALREYLKHFTRQFSLPVELSVLPELEGQDLPQTVSLQLLRIIQEALSNIRKHAHADCAHVSLTLLGACMQVIVSDGGLGFDLSADAIHPGSGFGFRSMRERAEALGGILQIDSAPGNGTRVIVEIPVSNIH